MRVRYGFGFAGLAVLVLVAAAPRDRYLAHDFAWKGVLPPPPSSLSAEGRADRDAFAAAAGPVDSAAWRAAISQLYPGRPVVTQQFACAAGHVLSAAATPATVRMLKRVDAEMAGPIEAAKDRFHRPRPYIGHPATPICDPRAGNGEQTVLSYSYPSGHAAFGELWARTLADADPAHADRILALGRAVGDNRVACGVHYPSDVAAGRTLGDALYAAISATPAFQADLAAARTELATAPPPPDCPAG